MPPNTFDNGVRAGRTEATLQDVRNDIAELKELLTPLSGRVWANSATVALLVLAVGFLYVSLVRGWF